MPVRCRASAVDAEDRGCSEIQPQSEVPLLDPDVAGRILVQLAVFHEQAGIGDEIHVGANQPAPAQTGFEVGASVTVTLPSLSSLVRVAVVST